MKRGAIKAFKEYMNREFAGTENHRNHQFHQETQAYGDYLYSQDRAKFDWEMNHNQEAHPNFDFKAWV